MINAFLKNLPELELPGHRGEGQDQIVYYVSIRCPNCGGKAPVRTTKPAVDGHRVRYHKCPKCGMTFKSVEHIQN